MGQQAVLGWYVILTVCDSLPLFATAARVHRHLAAWRAGVWQLMTGALMCWGSMPLFVPGSFLL
jgi:hypothetical protein